MEEGGGREGLNWEELGSSHRVELRGDLGGVEVIKGRITFAASLSLEVNN